MQTAQTDGVNRVHESLILKQSSLRTELEGAEGGLVAMNATAEALRARQNIMPDLAAQLHAIDRKLSVSQEVYAVLMTKRAQAEVSLAAAKTVMSSLRVVDYAVAPASQSWPKAKYLYPGALVAGLLLGMAAAMAVNVMNGKVYRRHLAVRGATYPLYAVLTVERAVRE